MDKALLKKSIERQALVVKTSVYRPKTSVVDYGGALCYTLEIPLEDGSSIRATSFELEVSAASQPSLEDVLFLLRGRCIQAFRCRGILPHPNCRDERLTEQYWQCL